MQGAGVLRVAGRVGDGMVAGFMESSERQATMRQGVPAWRRWTRVAGIVLLGEQVVGVGVGRLTDTRYFCWAPYDEITQFQLRVVINGRELSQPEVKRRYRLPHATRDNRSWAHVPAIIAHYECTRGSADGAVVEYRYRVNGGEARLWRWADGKESQP